MQFRALRVATASLFVAALAACGGGGGSTIPATPTSTTLTVTGTAATGLAIPSATVTGKCKVGTGTTSTLSDGSYILTITDGQLPCVLQVTNPVNGNKLHTVVAGTGNAAAANITPLTEMATARVLGSEPNVFFAAFDAATAVQKIRSSTVQSAQTDIGLVLSGTIDTTTLGNFISTPLKAATQGSPTSGDAQDKMLDALKLKLSTAQIGTITTALANNQTTTDAIKQTVISMTIAPTTPPVANAGAAQSVTTGTTVTLDASSSSVDTGKSMTYAWTLTSKPSSSAATLTSPATTRPTFVADVTGSYVATLIVNDGATDSGAAAVTVTATQSATVSTLAGSGAAGFLDGTGNSAQFYWPSGVATDVIGNVYVADWHNCSIRKVTPLGIVSTVTGGGWVGNGCVNNVFGGWVNALTLDQNGNIFVSAGGQIYKVDINGTITTFASAGNGGNGINLGYATGTWAVTPVRSPHGIIVDQAGNLYFTDPSNQQIGKITPNGVVTTIAGSGAQGFTDGNGTNAVFNAPFGISIDSAGNLFVADQGNNSIRKISASGDVSTLPGGSPPGWRASNANGSIFAPWDVAVDTAGNVYVADSGNFAIRKISSAGVLSTVAGTGIQSYYDGLGSKAGFGNMRGIAVGNNGSIYVADQSNNVIRKILLP